MDFDRYIRRPFAVEAVEITDENMEEVAKLVGEIRIKNGTRFIALDRRIVPNVNRAYVGWYMTRMADNYRCYSPKVFRDQFTDYADRKTFIFEEDEEPAATSETTTIPLEIK